MRKGILIFFIMLGLCGNAGASSVWDFYEKATRNQMSTNLEKRMHAEALRCSRGDNTACLTLGLGSFADSAWRVRELLNYFTAKGVVKKNAHKKLSKKIKKITPKKTTSRGKTWGKGNISVFKRQRIGKHEIEIHVDGNGPHIHLDRSKGKKGKYIEILRGEKLRSDARVLSLLPKIVRSNIVIQKSIKKAKKMWENH